MAAEHPSNRTMGRVVGATVAVLLLGVVGYLAIRFGRSPDLLAEARAAYQREDWEDASRLARARLKVVKDDREATRILARASVRLGRDESAMTLYNNRLGSTPMEVEDLYLRGLVLGRLGSGQMALDVWSGASKRSPEHPEMLYALSRLLTDRQRLDEAAAFALRVSKQPGWEARGLLQLGTVRSLMDDPAAAAEALERGLTLDPKAKGALLPPDQYGRLLARSLLQIGEPAKAKQYLAPLLKTKGTGETDREAYWLESRAELQEGKPREAVAALEKAGTWRAEHPLLPEPSPFVSAKRCDPCHSSIGHAYDQSRHARTFYRGDDLLKLPIPDHPLPDPDDPKVTHTLERVGDALRLSTQVKDQTYQLLVDYAFGTPERYFSMVGRDDKGTYRALRLSHYHDANGAGWGRTAGDAGNADPLANVRGQDVPTRDGVVRCVYCHVTNPTDFRNPALGKTHQSPAALDRGIGCERCHGPGANHLASASAGLADRAIINVGSSHAETINAQCSQCHVVGDPAEIRASPEDPKFVRSSGLTFTFSRCYTDSGGTLSCVTCHDPHRDSPRSAAFYEAKCLECHSPSKEPRPSTPTGIASAKDNEATDSPAKGAVEPSVCKVNPTKDCLGCHMPKIPVPVLHTSLTDHYIRIHDRNPAEPRESGTKTPPEPSR